MLVLVLSWQSFNTVAVNRGRGVTAGEWSAEIMLYYALPGLEAGFLIGLFPPLRSRCCEQVVTGW